jgi:hypothetical protein
MYELRGHSVEDFIEACKTFKEKFPEMYKEFAAILRSQGYIVSSSDMDKLNKMPISLSQCEKCSYYHKYGAKCKE